MKTILFQGDSITDAGRDYQYPDSLGWGYPVMTAGKIAVDFPGKYRMVNRGISGNRIVDLYARIKRDFINLEPDYISILIGVNDVWHELDFRDGVATDKFLRVYDQLITELKQALPQVQILILEPFVLSGPATRPNMDYFRREVAARAEACKAVAQKHGLIYIPLQKPLEMLADQCSSEQVLADGVHPTAAGHELISRALYDAYRQLL